MSYNNSTDDLRSIKTEKALFNSMFLLLEKGNFKKVTVKSICEEALISRAAFYAHYVDKYDLLKHWLSDAWLKIVANGDALKQLEAFFDSTPSRSHRIIKNLLNDADNETFALMFDFLLTILDINEAKQDDAEEYAQNVVLSTFYAGGILSYFLWQIKNRFPADIPIINKEFCEMIQNFKELKNDKR